MNIFPIVRKYCRKLTHNYNKQSKVLNELGHEILLCSNSDENFRFCKFCSLLFILIWISNSSRTKLVVTKNLLQNLFQQKRWLLHQNLWFRVTEKWGYSIYFVSKKRPVPPETLFLPNCRILNKKNCSNINITFKTSIFWFQIQIYRWYWDQQIHTWKQSAGNQEILNLSLAQGMFVVEPFIQWSCFCGQILYNFEPKSMLAQWIIRNWNIIKIC